MIDKRWSHTGRSTKRVTLAQHSIQHANAQREVAKLRKAFFNAYPGATFLTADYSVVEARVMAHELAFNLKPYYNLSMSRRSLTVVQLAIAAIEGGYRPVECFNHAVDGGIVFG